MRHTRADTLDPRLQFGGLVVAGIAFSFMVVWLVAYMWIFGRNIPQPDILTDYVRGWMWALGFAVLLAVLPLKDGGPLLKLWLAKAAVDLGFMLIYEWHYPLDAYWYFRMGSWAHFDSLWPVLGDGTQTILRFSVIVADLVGPSYHAMKIVYSFIGMCGSYCFYLAACHYLRSRKTWLLYLVGFTPTVLFWSSILGKDPVIFLGAGLYTLGTVGWLRTSRTRYALPLACGIMIAMFIREWYGVIMIAPLLFVVGPRLRHPLQRILCVAGGLAGMVYAYSIFQNQFMAEGTSSIVPTTNAIIGGVASRGGSGQSFQGFHSFGSMVLFWPWGVFTALFRPMIWDVHNAFMAISALECTVLLILVISAVRHWHFSRLRDPVIAWSLAYLLCWASLYGFGGYANLGMAVRQRLEAMPVIVLLALLLGTWRGRRYLDGGREVAR